MPIRQSRGTQYSKPFSESLTQPFASGCAQNLACVSLQERGGWGGRKGKKFPHKNLGVAEPQEKWSPPREQAKGLPMVAVRPCGPTISPPRLPSPIRIGVLPPA